MSDLPSMPTSVSLIDLMPTVYEGHLKKCGRVFSHSTKPCYVRVKGTCLLQYVSNNNEDNTTISPAKVIELTNFTLSAKNQSFTLSPKTDGRSYTYVCPSMSEYRKWTQVLRRITETQVVTMDDFEVITHVGSGSYGAVKLVRRCGDSELLALKEIPKDMKCRLERGEYETRAEFQKRCDDKNVKNFNWVMGERHCLEQTSDCPYLIDLKYAFEDATHWYLITSYVAGGDLFDHAYRQPNKIFEESVVQQWMAELVVALEYLQDRNMVHRDIKLENILLDLDGHAHLADFGFAAQLEKGGKSDRFCGTKFYIAPEMLTSNRSYDNAVDWWSLGVVMYELLNGITPFTSRSKSRLFAKIIQLEPVFLNEEMSEAAKDLVLQLMQKQPNQRIGYCREKKIRAHPFFNGINWAPMLRNTIKKKCL